MQVIFLLLGTIFSFCAFGLINADQFLAGVLIFIFAIATFVLAKESPKSLR